MMVMIGHASRDENLKARGGQSGDQDKKEVCTRTWYNKPWTSVIRPKDKNVAEKIAKAMEQACANNNIGYDQGQRTTLYTQAKATNWDLSKITTRCETDCSALVAVCVNAAGIPVSKDIYTGNELNALKNTGKFTIYTSSDYTTKSTNLKRGDILLGKGHTAIVLNNGANIETTTSSNGKTMNKTEKWKGIATIDVNVRTWAGSENKTVSFSPLKKDEIVSICDSEKDSKGVVWYYIKYNNKFGFVSSKYIKKQETNTTTNNKVEYAESYQKSLAGTYKTTANLNLRKGAGTSKGVICVIPKGSKVTCYGYFTAVGGTKWYLIVYDKYTGFASSKYLKK